ncbi:hypothetical protein K9M42_02800 [Patescibacteria group bacterium]|nr:hypothetical protein [Patescibacteria group bacterium]
MENLAIREKEFVEVPILFKYDDEGRKEAGFKGTTGDCVVRSISIVTEIPYKTIYDDITNFAKDNEHKGKRKKGISHARTGIYPRTTRKYLTEKLGFKWQPTMFIGQGCKVHLRANELPQGKLIVKTSKHITAVINGVIHDIYNCSRNGTRCVYGYYYK